MIKDRENDSEGHLSDSEDDGELHLHRVQVVELVFGQIPDGIDAERIRTTLMEISIARIKLEHQLLLGLDSLVDPLVDVAGTRKSSNSNRIHFFLTVHRLITDDISENTYS